MKIAALVLVALAVLAILLRLLVVRRARGRVHRAEMAAAVRYNDAHLDHARRQLPRRRGWRL